MGGMAMAGIGQISYCVYNWCLLFLGEILRVSLPKKKLLQDLQQNQLKFFLSFRNSFRQNLQIFRIIVLNKSSINK